MDTSPIPCELPAGEEILKLDDLLADLRSGHTARRAYRLD